MAKGDFFIWLQEKIRTYGGWTVRFYGQHPNFQIKPTGGTRHTAAQLTRKAQYLFWFRQWKGLTDDQWSSWHWYSPNRPYQDSFGWWREYPPQCCFARANTLLQMAGLDPCYEWDGSDAPTAPDDFAAAQDGTDILLTWTATYMGLSTIFFHIQLAPSAGRAPDRSHAHYLDFTAASDVSYRLSDMPPGMYHFFARVIRNDTGDPSDWVTCSLLQT